MSLVSFQLLSFIFLLMFASWMDGTSILSVILIIVESLIIVKIRKNLRIALFLWQFQVFIISLVGLSLYPKFFLNSTEVNTSIQAFLLIALIALESNILLLFKYSERSIVWILKGSTISMLCIVLLILALVGSEGLSGFIGNDPSKMLTTTAFNAQAQPGYTITSHLTAEVMPYDFTIEVSDSHVHMDPFSERNLSISVVNTGALYDVYHLSFENQTGISFSTKEQTSNLEVDSGNSSDVNGILMSTGLGSYVLNVVVMGENSNIEKPYAILVNVSTAGIDFGKDRGTVFAQGLDSSMINVPLSLVNTGDIKQILELRISAPAYFSPFLNIPEWNNSNKSAKVSLSPGEQLNFSFLPRFLTAVDGVYNLSVEAYALNGSEPIDTFNLSFDAKSTRMINSARPGNIPVFPGAITHWNMTILDAGDNHLGLTLANIPRGLNVSVLTNGTILSSSSEVQQVYLDRNGSATIELLVSTNNNSIGSSSTFDIDIITGGSQPSFGILGFIAGSVITTLIAIALAAPAGLACAIFLSQYCSTNLRRVIKPTMEILVGIPSVIFGLWGALTFGPVLASTLYPSIDATIGSIIPFFHGPYELGRSMMTASIVLAIMIFPIIMALSYEAISSISPEMKDASLALGATKWQTIRRVIFKNAKSGILAAIILGIGRALGETMAVLMIMNYSSSIPQSVFSSGATMTSAIAVNFTAAYANDQTRHGLFSIALILFLFVLVLNYTLLVVTKDKFWTRSKKGFSKFKPIIKKLLGRVVPENDHLKEIDLEEVQITKLKNSFYPSSRLYRSDRFMTLGLCSIAIIMISIVAYIIGDILVRGGLEFHLDYLTETQLSGGGFLNATTGSLMLVGVAILLAAPLTLMAALYVHEYTTTEGRMFKISYIAISTLSSTPSIIFGAFGFMLFVLYLKFGFSLLAGGLTLAFMAVPILYISNFEAIKAVPHTYREASYALGISKWKTIQKIVLPSSLPAISSGTMIGIGRIIGETAAVLFTAGFAMFLTTSISEPSASLPVMIYQLYDVSAGNPVLMQKVYAAAFLLITMVVGMNLVGKLIGYHYSRNLGMR